MESDLTRNARDLERTLREKSRRGLTVRMPAMVFFDLGAAMIQLSDKNDKMAALVEALEARVAALERLPPLGGGGGG